MGNKKVYINSVAQISIQKPLCDEWMLTPVLPTQPYTRAIDPDFRQWLNPIKSRRWGKLLKRALVTSMSALKDANLCVPDAIVMGTGDGCLESTEKMIDGLIAEGEDASHPTHFMQSTHNTIASLLAIQTQCHGYNNTYSHDGISFESALLDAILQIQLSKIGNALVGCNDEVTPKWFSILERAGMASSSTIGEGSVAMVISGHPANALCEIERIDIGHHPILPETTGGHMISTEKLKTIFGVTPALAGLGVVVAATLIREHKHDSIAVINHDGPNVSIIKLKRCG